MQAWSITQDNKEEDTKSVEGKDIASDRCSGCGMPIIRIGPSADDEITNAHNKPHKRPRYALAEFFRGLSEPTNSDFLSGLKTMLSHRLLTHKVARKRWDPAMNRCGFIKAISLDRLEPYFVIHHAYEAEDEFHMLSDRKMETRRNRYGQAIWKLKVRICHYHSLSFGDLTAGLSNCVDHIAACVLPFGMGIVSRHKHTNNAAVIWIRTPAVTMPSLEQLCARYIKRHFEPIDIVSLLPVAFVEDGLFQIEWK